jgi:hypothetical protein
MSDDRAIFADMIRELLASPLSIGARWVVGESVAGAAIVDLAGGLSVSVREGRGATIYGASEGEVVISSAAGLRVAVTSTRRAQLIRDAEDAEKQALHAEEHVARYEQLGWHDNVRGCREQAAYWRNIAEKTRAAADAMGDPEPVGTYEAQSGRDAWLDFAPGPGAPMGARGYQVDEDAEAVVA